MKLSYKMMLLSTLIIFITLAACLLLTLAFARENTMENVERIAKTDYGSFLSSFSNDIYSGNVSAADDAVVKNSYLKYCFSRQVGRSEYVLQQGDIFLVNNTGIDPTIILSSETPDFRKEAYGKHISLNGEDYYILCRSAVLLGEEYTLSLVRNITDTMKGLQILSVNCIIVCSILALISAVAMIFIVWRSLRPMKELAAGTESFAAGEYDTRVHIKGKNEFADLADRFNAMAATIGGHIEEIEATSEERKLLLSSLAHEMKTPVTAITGYSHALTHAKLTDDQQDEAITFIDNECRRLERLSGKLTQLISAGGTELILHDVLTDEFAQELASILTPSMDVHGIKLSITTNGEKLQAEKDLLICAVTNLADNARKAGAAHIAIEISEKHITVRDDGKGIPEAELEKVKKPFYMVDKSRNAEGFGLGLALVEKIAQLHNMDLSIYSEVGKGTTVMLSR